MIHAPNLIFSFKIFLNVQKSAISNVKFSRNCSQCNKAGKRNKNCKSYEKGDQKVITYTLEIIRELLISDKQYFKDQ